MDPHNIDSFSGHATVRHPVFDPIVGQEYAVAVLSEAITTSRLAGSYLFVGPEGSGKNTTALRFAAALCGAKSAEDPLVARILANNYPDVRTTKPVPPRRNISVAQIWPRNESPEFRADAALLKDLNYEPLYSPNRVYVIDHAEGLSIGGSEAANSLLKTLEEPPGYARFILTAVSVTSMLPTIVSRCQIVRFGPLSRADVVKVICDQKTIDRDRANLLASLSNGNVGKALELDTNTTLLEARDRIFDVFLRIEKSPAVGFARLAEDFRNACKIIQMVSSDEDSDSKPAGVRSGTLLGLEMLSSCFRDRLVLSLGLLESSLNNPDLACVMKPAQSASASHCVTDSIAKVSAIKEMISFNGNNQLCTELLMCALVDLARRST